MTFSIRHSQIQFCCTINVITLERFNGVVLDLGPKLTSSLDFCINMVCCKALKSLGLWY